MTPPSKTIVALTKAHEAAATERARLATIVESERARLATLRAADEKAKASGAAAAASDVPGSPVVSKAIAARTKARADVAEAETSVDFFESALSMATGEEDAARTALHQATIRERFPLASARKTSRELDALVGEIAQAYGAAQASYEAIMSLIASSGEHRKAAQETARAAGIPLGEDERVIVTLAEANRRLRRAFINHRLATLGGPAPEMLHVTPLSQVFAKDGGTVDPAAEESIFGVSFPTSSAALSGGKD